MNELPVPIELKRIFVQWYRMAVRMPPTIEEEAAQLGLTVPMAVALEQEVSNEAAIAKIFFDAQNEAEKNRRIREIDTVIYEQALAGKPKHAELFLRRNGLLIDKTENKHLVMTLDDCDRLRGEAQRELGQELQGIREMPDKPALLPDKVCED